MIVEVPHAGLALDAGALRYGLFDASSVRRDADLYVDALAADAPAAGASVLLAPMSRYVIDLNRDPSAYDREAVRGALRQGDAPRGVVWRVSGAGTPLLRSPLSPAEFERRLREYFVPYHHALQQLCRDKVEQFGICVILALHSMPSQGAADVVPGTRGRTTASSALIDVIENWAAARQYSLVHDVPYAGGYTTLRYGQPQTGVHAIQVELARRLYMDEASLEALPNLQHVRQSVTELVRATAEVARASANDAIRRPSHR